jgi:bifunctional UDP-N-acetylglucosamine pyrophosphorylase/glucosamine-1-phosphate N-acetyltransferase
MWSDIPKALHLLGGRPLLQHVMDTAWELSPDRLHVVYGHGGDSLRQRFGDPAINWVVQDRQLGTGHAVAQALPDIPDDHTVLVLYGDVPLVAAETLRRLCAAAAEGSLAVLTAHLRDPRGYGRIRRDVAGRVTGIVEETEASEQERLIDEVNTGFMAAPAGMLRRWVNALDDRNSKGEFYLTDVVARAVAERVPVTATSASSAHEIAGINDRVQLATVERAYQRRQAEALMRTGVTLMDPARFDLRGHLHAGRDVVIDVNVILEGEVRLGDRVSIGPNCCLRNTILGDDVTVLANCVVDDAVIGERSRIGPFSRIRPETRLAGDTRIGNFVEIKKSEVGTGSKINHLSYVGDTTVGRDVNIGAGTITCNYDGANKHRTVIGDDAFIGSDTQLVAPVEVGRGATIGAGSTITRDVPPGELSLSRAPQETRHGWRRPEKKR